MQKSKFRQIVEKALQEAKIYKCMPDEEIMDIWGINPDESIRVVNNPTVEQYKSIQSKLGIVRGLADKENFYVPMDDEMIHGMILNLIEKNNLPLSTQYFDIRDDGNSLYALTNENVKFESIPIETLFKQLGREQDIQLAKKYVEALANLNNDFRLHFKDIETLQEFYSWIDNITKVDGFLINTNDLVIDDQNLIIYKKDWAPTGEYFV